PPCWQPTWRRAGRPRGGPRQRGAWPPGRSRRPRSCRTCRRWRCRTACGAPRRSRSGGRTPGRRAYAIDDLTGGQPGPPRVPEVVRRAVVLRRSIGKLPSPVRVVPARQQTGQYDDGRGGAAPSQIHLDGVEPPLLTAVPGCHKVDAQRPDYLALGKKPPDTLAVLGQLHGVVPAGRETAALVDLPVVPAQDLLVSCENQ